MSPQDRRENGLGGKPAEGIAREPITDLASLLAPCSEEQLVSSFLQKQRLFVKSGDPRRAASLLPRWTIDRLIASDFLPAKRLEALRNGEVVAPHLYRTEDGRLRLGALDTLIAEGVSFIVNGIDDDVPAIARLSDSLERKLGHSVWVNSYITHGRGGALPPHYDDHDVIVLQAHGKKRWFGHGAPHPSPIVRSPDGEDFGPPQWDVLLEPGDVLYLPRGEVHHTSVEGSPSVHLTLGIDTRRGVDFLASIVETASADERFREDLTRLGGKRALELGERQLKDRMHALIEQADLEGYLTSDDAERALRPLAHLGNAPVMENSVVVPTPRRPLVVPPHSGDAIDIRTGGQSFRLSSMAARVLSFLIDHDRSTQTELAASLPGDPTEQVVRESVVELVRLGLAGVEPADDRIPTPDQRPKTKQ